MVPTALNKSQAKKRSNLKGKKMQMLLEVIKMVNVVKIPLPELKQSKNFIKSESR